MKRQENEFKENLKEQMNFLQKSCSDYDNGDESEAKRISVVLRNLLKDKGRDISALQHLNKKEIKFLDTTKEFSGFCNFIINNMSNCTVTVPYDIHMGAVVKLINGCNNAFEYEFKPLFINPRVQNEEWVDFEEWYGKVILDEYSGNKLTREKLILSVAEQDGGNHFDDSINSRYSYFKGNDSLKMNVNGNIVIFKNNPAFASLRQIAHEVTESIYKDACLKRILL